MPTLVIRTIFQMARSLPLAAIMAHLSREQIDICAWHFFDGMTQLEIGRLLGVSQQAVDQRITTVCRKLEALGIPLPKRMVHPTPARFIRNVTPGLLGSI